MPLTPFFSFCFQKEYIIWWRLKNELSKSIKSSGNYECLKLWCSGSRPRNTRSGANALVTSAGEAGFLAFEAILCSAGFHLKFLAFKSCEVWSQPPKLLNPPRNGIRQYRLGLFDRVRGLRLSVLSRRIASKTSKWRQVKANVCHNVSGLTCFIYLWTNGRLRVVKTKWKGTRKTKSCSEWW